LLEKTKKLHSLSCHLQLGFAILAKATYKKHEAEQPYRIWSDRMQIEATNRTPAVSISSTGIEIKGECYPEDITAFAEPVMEALRQQLESAESFHARIELYYFNSSSAKFLFDFFEELEEAAEEGKQIQIDWCYRADDSSMQEAGEDFEEDFEHAQYQIVEI